MNSEKNDTPYSTRTRTSIDWSQSAEDYDYDDEMHQTYRNTYAHNNRSASILNNFKSYNDESISKYDALYHSNLYKSFIDKGLV